MYKGSLLLVNANYPLPMDYQPQVLMNISNTASSPMYLEKIAGIILMGNNVDGVYCDVVEEYVWKLI